MQRDYIMRLIEQIAALMASIIAKERAGKYPEAKVEIDEKARQTIGECVGTCCARSVTPGKKAPRKGAEMTAHNDYQKAS